MSDSAPVRAIAVYKAALIATWYGPRPELDSAQDALQSLVDRLVAALALKERPDRSWVNEENRTWLLHFPAAAARDTAVVQLALNAPDEVEAKNGWVNLRSQLEDAVGEAPPEGIWGHSLLYQAELATPAPEGQMDALLLELARAVRPLQPQGLVYARPLVTTATPAGWLWLLDIPLPKDGHHPANLYMAASRPGQSDQMVGQDLYGPEAHLLMPDLIAHKGYHQMGQYRGDLDEIYRARVDALHDSARQLLNGLGEGVARDIDLKSIRRAYVHLIEATTLLESLRINLARFQRSLAPWRQEWPNPIVDYHAQHIQTAVHELDQLTEEGKVGLEFARMGVQMVQTETDRERAQREKEEARQEKRRRRRTEIILAVVGVALAIPQLVDREVVDAMLAGEYHILLLVGGQLLLMLMVLVLALWLLRLRG